MDGFLRSAEHVTGEQMLTSARRLERIAEELTAALDEIVFTIEHGVPGEILARLGDVVAKIESVDLPDPVRAERLRRAAVDLDEAKRGMWRADPAATDHVLRRGRGIVEVLRNRNATSGR